MTEEGEIFRKGQALLSAEEMESEYAGEELRQGVCIIRPPFDGVLMSLPALGSRGPATSSTTARQ